MEKLPHLPDDGLFTPEVGEWSVTKYRLVSFFASVFATSMKAKWDARVYIDLFAGAGKARIKNTKIIVPASPLLALSIADKFDKYIFCEADQINMNALKERTTKENHSVPVDFIEGDVNKNIDIVLNSIIPYKPGYKVLSFCFIDPFNVKNLKFKTIEKTFKKIYRFLNFNSFFYGCS